MDISQKAAACGVQAQSIDGMDVLAVESAACEAAAAIRAGNGPRLLECRTYRLRAHSMFDAQLYRDKDGFFRRNGLARAVQRIAASA